MTVGGQAAYYVYGVVPAEQKAVPAGVTGIAGTSVELVEHAGVAAVVSAITPELPLGRKADLVAHGRVLDEFATGRAVVPLRFGTVLPDGADVVDELLEPLGDRFHELLDELSGRAQFNLRGRYDEAVVLSEIVTENPEIAELRQRTRGMPEAASYYARIRLGELVARALAAKREADGGVILDALLPYSVAHQLRDGARIDGLLEAAFLVDADQQEAFDQAAERAAAALSGRATLRLVGPVAPYDFVSEI